MKRLRFTAAGIASLLFLAAAVPALAAAQPAPPPAHSLAFLYKDWDPQAWWATDVQLASDIGFFHGYPDGTFRPDGDITRAEFATILVRAAGYALPDAPGSGGFSDVRATDWFAPYVDSLVHFGVIQHADYPSGALHPNDPITRGEMATWIGRVLRQKGAASAGPGKVTPMRVIPQGALRAATANQSGLGTPIYSKIRFVDLALPTAAASVSFPDVTQAIPHYAEIMRAARYGVIQGYPDGSFRPARPATRAEAAKMVDVLVNELTANPPSVQALQSVIDAINGIATSVEKTLPKTGLTQQMVGEDLWNAGIGQYDTRHDVASDRAIGVFQFKLHQPLVWYWTDAPAACQSVFLGATVAEADCVTGPVQYGWNGQPLNGSTPAYHGALYLFVKGRAGHWREAGGEGYDAVPSWFTALQQTR